MHVAVLAEALQRHGLEVDVICDPTSPLMQDLQQRRIAAHPLAAGGYLRPGAVRRGSSYLRQIAPKVIHLHYARDLWWLVPALRLTKPVSIVLSKHVGTQKPKRDVLHRWLYSHVHTMIAISTVIHHNIVATHPIDAKRVKTVHFGLDLRYFQPQMLDRQQLRRQLGYSEKEKVIGIVGRVQASKGYFEFLQMAEALKRRPDVRFLMVGGASRGEDSEAARILRYIDERGLRDRVQWLGFRKDVPALMATMDICTFPSHAEAFGLVIIEAMAMQRPIVSSNCDGVLDIITDEVNGLLVPPKNAAALTAAVERLLDQAALAEQIARRGRLRVEVDFNIETMIQKIREIYESAVNT